MARMGRKPIELDKEKFELLCKVQCTKEEIADEFGCSDDTINNWCKRNYFDESGAPMTFSAVFAQKRGAGKTSLRRRAWRMVGKNAAVTIFFCKNMLGMSDNPENSVDQEDTEAYFDEAGLNE